MSGKGDIRFSRGCKKRKNIAFWIFNIWYILVVKKRRNRISSMYKVKYREGIKKLRIWERRVGLKGREFLGYIVCGSASNFNFCQAFDSIFL